MADENKYNSSIAEGIEASGNVINNVKKPWFVLGLVIVVGIFFITYKYFENQKDIAYKSLENQRESLLILQKIKSDSQISREEMQKQTGLFVKQNEILKHQGN